MEEPVIVYTNEQPMKNNSAYLKVCTEHDIPYEELLTVANEIWDKSPAEQDEIRERKAKEFAEKYPLKNRGPAQHIAAPKTEEGKPWKYCVVGNIVRERIDKNGQLRYGTVAFRGGARVYIEGKNYDYDYVRDGIEVLGMNRYGRYVYEYIPKDQIENVRFSRTYEPMIMDMMHEYEGHDGWWGNSDEDGLDAKQFAVNWPEFQKMKPVGD